MAKRWRILSHDQQRIAHLRSAANIPAVLAQLLLARGIDRPEQVRDFLDSRLSGLRDPDLLPGARAAAERLAAAVADGKRIVVYGDYDADGMTASAILLLGLRLVGAQVEVHVPNRLEDGYGLNSDALQMLAARGANTIVTVDCGVTSCAEADLARSLGLELIVTDHHQPGSRLPDAAAIVHPALPGQDYPFPGLSGAGVALKVAWALCQEISGARRVGERMKNFLLQAVGLAAVGTVADVVPLIDENRILVRYGLWSLREHPTPGLAALMQVGGLNEKPQLASEDIAFNLGPRLNAAGRLGQSQLAVELLTTDCPDRAQQLAKYLHELNGQRSTLERSVYLSANKQAQEDFDPGADPALVLAHHDWHPGVIGIVAGRLAEKFHRPVVMVAFDPLGVKPGIGSARSVAKLALHTALDACGEHLLSYGGHAAAAGLKIEASNLAAFRTDFCEYVAGEVSEDDRLAELLIDAESPLAALTTETVDQIERLAPFGEGNPRPVLCTSEVKLAEPPQRIGEGGRHLAVKLEQHGIQLRGVAFGRGEWADGLGDLDGTFSVAFQPVINHFRGMRSVELHLTDWQVDAPAALSCPGGTTC